MNAVSFACIMRVHVPAIQLRAIPANTNLTLPCGQRTHLVMYQDKTALLALCMLWQTFCRGT